MLRQERTYIFRALDNLMDVFGRVFFTDLVFRLLAFILLTPLSSWLLQRAVQWSGRTAISNTDIFSFIFTPVGIIGLTLFAAITLAISYAGQSVLLTVAFGQQEEGETVSYVEALLFTSKHAFDLTVLGVLYIANMSVFVLPVAAVLLLVYRINLSAFDINYYLAERPPELWWSIAIVSPFLIVLAIILSYLVIAWLFAVPSILFGNVSPLRALRHSRRLVHGSWWRLVRVLLAWLVLGLMAAAFALVTTRMTGDWLIGRFDNSLAAVVLIIVAVLLLTSLIGYIATFLFAAVSIFVGMAFYRELSAAQGYTNWMNVDDLEQFDWTLSRRWFWGLAVFGVLLAGLFGYFYVSNFDTLPVRQTTATAHRGSSRAAPGNSAAAVRQAIADGATYVEIDVQETADGVLILNHDSDYLLAAGVAKGVHELTYAETQQLEIGSAFSADFTGEPIPTLAEILDLANGKADVLIELKQYGHQQNLAERVATLVQAKQMEDSVRVMSLSYSGVRKIRRVTPAIKIGYVASAFTLGDLTELDVDFLAVSTSLASAELIDRAHGKGKELFVWTINDPEEMSRFIGRGVDSIITDDPALFQTVLRERSQMSDIERLLLDFSYILAE